MDITINDKQPTPAIYNVKQYTSSDVFVFYMPLSELDLLDTAKLTANIITKNFTTEITPEIEQNDVVIKWNVSAKETAKSGRFELQLELTDGERIWRSYKAVFVVSDSVDGGNDDASEDDKTEEESSYTIGIPEPIVSGVVSDIVGVPEEMEEDEENE
jgi:hypothetical protein